MSTFILPGEPTPKGRPRFSVVRGKVHTYTPAKTLAAEQEIQWRIRGQVQGPPSKEQFHVALAFYCKSKTVDIDNLVKLIFDAANGIVWVDDKQVASLHAVIHRGSTDPHTVVQFSEIQSESVAA